jgi:SAM-dependent methyltransferase
VTHPRFQAALEVISETRLEALERIVGEKGSLLDVGCGTGEFPAVAARRGWRVQGVELMAEAAARARERGLDVHTGYLEESGLPERSYDVVSALHVLEHIPESIPFIRLLARYVRPGGHVMIEVPNFGSELRERTLGGWIHLRPLEHLVHFTPDTLRRALSDSGLEVVSVTTPSWPQREHTLEEALANLGRPTWRGWLAPFCSTREVVGVPSKVPSSPVRWLLRAVERTYRRRLRGMVVVAIARVP